MADSNLQLFYVKLLVTSKKKKIISLDREMKRETVDLFYIVTSF